MTSETDAPVDASEAESAPEQQPLLRVVGSDATPEEIAALTAVFAALGSNAAPAPARRTPVWASHQRKLRGEHLHGRGAWRASSLPR